MDLADITQLTLVATFTLVTGRIGWSLARLIDRRASRQPALTHDAAERIRTLEDEQMALRQEVAELQERQDFTERVLLREQRPPLDLPAPEQVVTPH
jgi:cell division protein FtsB